MALNEASEQFQISANKLREYEANGLLGDTTRTEELSDHSEQFIRRVCLISFLLKSGVERDSLKNYLRMLNGKTESRKEQLRMLRKQRCKLLNEIHDKQQILDKPDYLIRETKNNA